MAERPRRAWSHAMRVTLPGRGPLLWAPRPGGSLSPGKMEPLLGRGPGRAGFPRGLLQVQGSPRRDGLRPSTILPFYLRDCSSGFCGQTERLSLGEFPENREKCITGTGLGEPGPSYPTWGLRPGGPCKLMGGGWPLGPPGYMANWEPGKRPVARSCGRQAVLTTEQDIGDTARRTLMAIRGLLTCPSEPTRNDSVCLFYC